MFVRQKIVFCLNLICLCVLSVGSIPTSVHAQSTTGTVPVVTVRSVFQAIQATVSWKSPNVLIERGADRITLTVGSRTATKNSITVTLNQPIRVNASGAATIATTDIYTLAQSWRGLQDDSVRLSVGGTTHTVTAGESLWSIAARLNVTIENLRLWNSLGSDVLKVGERIYIEEPYRAHVVEAGDTLWLIAKEHQTTVQAIVENNQLSSQVIYPGMTLKVPVPTDMRGQPVDLVEKPLKFASGIFPLLYGTYQQYGDTWGQSRTFGGERPHEGTDIMATRGIPLFSATDGTIVSVGWSQYGGWRVSIKTDAATAMYYAHLSGYAPGMVKGALVKQGQLIGYVGDTGYGTEGTSGKFASHLHFGMYDLTGGSWVAFNGYPYLRWWEQR